MRKFFSFVFLVFSFVLSTSLLAEESNDEVFSAKSFKNIVYVEVLGAAPFASLNYERKFLNDNLSARVGLGYAGLGVAHVFSFPVLLNFIGLKNGSHGLEVGAGASFLTGSIGDF